jgi:L-ascorbate metabolism protein UlaG (beta-lactamase superfamily)
MIKSVLKKVALGIVVLVIVSIVGIIAFIKLAPQFGKSPSGEYLAKIEQSPNYGEGIFVNLIETTLEYSFSNSIAVMKAYNNAENVAPESVIETKFDQPKPDILDSTFRVTWYGHSAILLEFSGKRIFLDPMLGDYAAPVPFFGQRFHNSPEFDLEDLGELDAVIFSHDHYDHLDYPTVKAIHEKVGHFYVPLGVGSHLRHWGVPEEKITELDWWQSATLEEFEITTAPARHFSGRSVGDANKTLWASWVINSRDFKLYFSGDGGYGPHFKEIGERLGPFDFAMMECGQYNEFWNQIHMMPEETVQATLDINAKRMMPIHWGSFTLAPHAWIDPAERVLKAANEAGLPLVTPEVGESFLFASEMPQTYWWRLVD